MCFSYVMGIGTEINELLKNGFSITPYGNDFGVSFSSDKAELWESFIVKHLKQGFWNEYIDDKKIIFSFNLSNGIKRYVVTDFSNNEVLQLCEKLANRSFASMKEMLNENEFYRNNIK